MKFSEIWPRARNAVADRASVAADKARERLVVIGGYRPGLSLKVGLLVLLVAFLAGGYVGVRWDMSRFAKFRADAAKLNAEVQAKNRKLANELEALRGQLAANEAATAAADKAFVDIINSEAVGQCTVPVGPLNVVIAEAGK